MFTGLQRFGCHCYFMLNGLSLSVAVCGRDLARKVRGGPSLAKGACLHKHYTTFWVKYQAFHTLKFNKRGAVNTGVRGSYSTGGKNRIKCDVLSMNTSQKAKKLLAEDMAPLRVLTSNLAVLGSSPG